MRCKPGERRRAAVRFWDSKLQWRTPASALLVEQPANRHSNEPGNIVVGADQVLPHIRVYVIGKQHARSAGKFRVILGVVSIQSARTAAGSAGLRSHIDNGPL